jgi:3-methyladenine DNA glycosylase Mpg
MIVFPEYFYNNDTVFLARDLIGKNLMRRIGKDALAYRITETLPRP